MEKDYYKRYRVSFNPESDKDREIIDYLEKFSSGSGRTHALKELLYSGMKVSGENVAEILDPINKKLCIITEMLKDAGVSSDFNDHATDIYEAFCKEYAPELKKYNSKIIGTTDNEGLYILTPTVKILDLYDTAGTNSTSKNNINENGYDII